MKTVLRELFERFVAGIASNHADCLVAEPGQAAEIGAKVKSPVATVVVRGRCNRTEEPLAVVLMTTPAIAADDPALLDFIVRRARANKTPYFVTWTLRDAILWATPKPGTPAARSSIDKVRDYPDLYEIAPAEQGVIDEPTKLKILDRGQEILHDLERLLKDEALGLVQVDATYFVGRLLDAVHRLLPLVADSLLLRLQTDHAFRGEMAVWAVRQGIAGDPQDPDFARSIARQIIYRLLGKVLFYQSLRRSARQLPDLDLRGVDSAQVLPTLRAAFARALEIDYYAVFAEDLPDRIQWPAEASRELAALIQDFHTRDFSHVPQDVIGAVFEQLIPPEERHGLGQYFTPENLCDLIIGFCVRSPTDCVLDPTCGTGTFLIRAYDRLRWLGQTDHVKLLSQLWGVDIAPFPAELATINLFRQRVAEHGNFPRIICRDIFNVSPGERFAFPPPKVDFQRPQMIDEPIPQFDAIIGNFPYVSQDQIEKYQGGYREFLRQRLIDGWFEPYPELFYYKTKRRQQEFERLAAVGQHAGCDRADVQHRISTYADLYVHLFFHAARFLKPGGRMGIVTSNAWLDVNYGYELQKFLSKHFKIVAILESRCEPWFVEASVNTVVTVVERCADQAERDHHLVKFVKVKRPLADLIPGDPVIDAAARWSQLRTLVGHIEQAGRKYAKTHPLGMVTEEDGNVRVRVLRQGEMLAELQREGKTVKWGRYLRAPQVYFDMLREGKFSLLRELATPLRGGMTRINEFFHVTPEVAQQFGIEDEYLLPLIKSPKETNTITVDPADLKLRIFVCRKSKAELKKLGHTGALKYIEWGEQQTYDSGPFRGLPWPEGTWVKDRTPGWYALPANEFQSAHVFYTAALSDKHLHRYCQTALVADKRLYFLAPEARLTSELLAAMLNCSVSAIACELSGRVTMGDGALEVVVEDVRDYLFLPDLRCLDSTARRRISATFRRLLERPIGTVVEEVTQQDRIAFDREVLAAIGLDPKKYLKPLYEGLCELVRERIELGKMRSKARKTKARGERAAAKVAEAVLDEVLGDGPRRFPDDFFSPAAAAGPKIPVELPDEPLLFEHTPMFMGVHVQGGSYDRQVRCPAEGKFLLYAQQAGHKVAQVPEKTVEVTRTVANYEKYLRELHAQLYDAYYRRTLDTRTAARLTQAAFDRFHLPSPEGV